MATALLTGAGAATAATFAVTVTDNPDGDFAARGWLDPASDFQRNIRAAAAIWGAEIDASATLALRVEATRGLARAGGTFSNGRFLGRTALGDLFEPGPLSRILTGSNPGGPPDLFLRINAAFAETFYWFDPTPEDRRDNSAPPDRTEFVSIVLHELGHGLGFAGTRSATPGPGYGLLASFHNPFDALSRFAAGMPFAAPGVPSALFFDGARAQQRFGGPVPLSHVGPAHPLASQDFYHLGTCGSAPELVQSLMNGCAVPRGAAILEITAIDRAVLADLGYPLRAIERVFGDGFEGSSATR